MNRAMNNQTPSLNKRCTKIDDEKSKRRGVYSKKYGSHVKIDMYIWQPACGHAWVSLFHCISLFFIIVVVQV